MISFKDNNFITTKNSNSRFIGYSIYNDVILTGVNNFYPNIRLLTDNKIINPYDEKIMSFGDNLLNNNNNTEYILDNNTKTIIDKTIYFFIYNLDNYYHFIYDTLPYLYYLKEYNLTDTILVNYAHENINRLYDFNIDVFNKLELKYIIHDSNNIYKTLIVPASLTHGGYSNDKPEIEFYNFFDKYLKFTKQIKIFPQKIYVSRRTHINNNTSNIGTNYTTRRKMINEDLLVSKLNDLGITEIFTENLTIEDKINLFSNATLIIGVVGGGMTNLLFSNKNTKTINIVTPYFLDINYRFRYCVEHTDYIYFDKVKHSCTSCLSVKHSCTSDNHIPLYSRIKYKNKIGEIIKYCGNDLYEITLSENIAGFNLTNNYDIKIINIKECEILDKGLNSPYIVDIDELIKIINI
jgi:hypothetical protein